MKKNILSFPRPRGHELDGQIRFAIANKRLIRFTYEGVMRVAEPHDYGLRDGATKLLAYERQNAGLKDLRVRGWRWLDTAKIDDGSLLEDSFSGTREAADQQHHHWDVLYARGDHPTGKPQSVAKLVAARCHRPGLGYKETLRTDK